MELTIVVLTYGDHGPLVERCLSSILSTADRSRFRLHVGANAVGDWTRRYLQGLLSRGAVDRVVWSDVNLGKNGMMRRLLGGVATEWLWWWDDDGWIASDDAPDVWWEAARGAAEDVVQLGRLCCCDDELSFTRSPSGAVGFVRTAPWYRGLPPPSWRPGGKGEFDFRGGGTGDGRWFFVAGGCWMGRVGALRALDWPDRRLFRIGEDVFLGEAIRQRGWRIAHLDYGVRINEAERRGVDPGMYP